MQTGLFERAPGPVHAGPAPAQQRAEGGGIPVAVTLASVGMIRTSSCTRSRCAGRSALTVVSASSSQASGKGWRWVGEMEQIADALAVPCSARAGAAPNRR